MRLPQPGQLRKVWELPHGVGVQFTMPLREFVNAHPRCTVGRPTILGPLLATLIGGAGCLIAAALALNALSGAKPDSMGGLVLLTFAAAGVWLALRSLPRLSGAARARRGGAAYAIADESLMLVGRSGRAVVIDLDRITRLTMQGDEPRLYTDADGQGLVHATMFELFDADGFGPSGERFFERLAPRLRSQAPRARISRSGLVDAGLIHEHP